MGRIERRGGRQDVVPSPKRSLTLSIFLHSLASRKKTKKKKKPNEAATQHVSSIDQFDHVSGDKVTQSSVQLILTCNDFKMLEVMGLLAGNYGQTTTNAAFPSLLSVKLHMQSRYGLLLFTLDDSFINLHHFALILLLHRSLITHR